jgi:hypothetical protein
MSGCWRPAPHVSLDQRSIAQMKRRYDIITRYEATQILHYESTRGLSIPLKEFLTQRSQ